MHLVSFSLWLISFYLLDEQRETIGSNQPLLIQLWRNLSTFFLPVTRLALCFVLASASNCPCFRTTCQGLTRAQVACISNRHPRRLVEVLASTFDRAVGGVGVAYFWGRS